MLLDSYMVPGFAPKTVISRSRRIARSNRAAWSDVEADADRLRRIQEAVAVEMLCNLPKWNSRLTETLTPQRDHVLRSVRHESRIPSAVELGRSILPKRDAPRVRSAMTVIVPLAFHEKESSLVGFSLDGSHSPMTVVNKRDGEEFTRRILARMIDAGKESDYWYRVSTTLAGVLSRYYIQFVEVSVDLGDTISVEYSVKTPRHDSSLGTAMLHWRLALGWRQNRFRFESTFPDSADSYHFRFEVPDGYYLKSIRPETDDGGYAATGAGTPDGHIYRQRPRQDFDQPRPQYFFVDCFESPPGSQGYASIIGLVTTTIIVLLVIALDHQWLLDDAKENVQATGAIALIAGAPALVASLLPLKSDHDAAIRNPLTARVSLWFSSALSAFVAFVLATRGFGLNLVDFDGGQMFDCFWKGLLVVMAVAVPVFASKRATDRFGWIRPLTGCVAVLFIVGVFVRGWGDVDVVEYFFSVVLPLYVLVWARSLWGWAKSVIVVRDVTRRR